MTARKATSASDSDSLNETFKNYDFLFKTKLLAMMTSKILQYHCLKQIHK